MRRIIGFGGENIVSKLNNDTVTKIPFGIRYFINPLATTNEIIADLKVLQTHFKKYLAPTKIVPRKNIFGIQSYTLTQEYIKGAPLKKSYLDNKDVKQQFLEIMKINETMLKSENKSYEFFGAWTLTFSHIVKKMANIMVERETNRLYIIDIGVLYLGENYHSKLLGFIYKWAGRKQEKLLEGFWGSLPL
ncbi:MAG: hypothetical protein ABIG91_03300 [Patescibacteria group bacterium]